MNKASPDSPKATNVGQVCQTTCYALFARFVYSRCKSEKISTNQTDQIARLDEHHYNLVVSLMHRIVAALPNNEDLWDPPISGYFPTIPYDRRSGH
jgi:hypothetical protein